MKEATRTKILQTWDAAEEEFPDKSTEFLFTITAERAGVDHAAVTSALYWQYKQGQKK